MIQAKIVADSLTERGHRLTTMEIVFPRYILAELNTHRMLSKNSASSRAIPFRKMVKSVLTNPFIPYAFQKDHLGMQGTEYFDNNTDYSLPEFLTILSDTFKYQSDLEFKTKEDKQILSLLTEITDKQKETKKTLQEWWLYCRDKAVKCAILMASLGVTKQLVNRLLEPFMYHKVLISATEFENFFNLRCPRYTWEYEDGTIVAKSKEEFIKMFIARYPTNGEAELHEMELVDEHLNPNDSIEWYKVNEGQADIHMMFLAEAIYDAINESIPREFKEGEWHIPYSDDMDEDILLDKGSYGFEATNIFIGEEGGWTIEGGEESYYYDLQKLKCKISIARCARLSYQTLGDNPVIDYEKDLKLYDSLYKSKHASPFEHVARVMTEKEYNSYVKGKMPTNNTSINVPTDDMKGWCRNFQGFIMYRELLD